MPDGKLDELLEHLAPRSHGGQRVIPDDRAPTPDNVNRAANAATAWIAALEHSTGHEAHRTAHDAL